MPADRESRDAISAQERLRGAVLKIYKSKTWLNETSHTKLFEIFVSENRNTAE